MDYNKRLEKIENKENIYVCGLDIISFGVIDYLKQKGKKVCGIIDKSFSAPVQLFGTTCYPLSWISEEKHINTGFVITAFKEKHRVEYAEYIERLYSKEDYVVASNTTEIRIDVSGICNLRCPSCHVGNHSDKDFDYTNRGFMDVELFDRILEKIEKEIPDNPAIYLFSLGEPLLNKNLPVMIEHIHRHGWMAVVSSNLSVNCDLESVMKANPDVIKISVSGFTQEIYETTHKGGNVERVKSNMETIHRLIKQYDLSTKVMVGYHVYTNNKDCEFEQMKDFSEKLGFLFEPVEALYFNMFKCTGYTPFTEEDRQFIRSFYPNPDKILNNTKVHDETNKTCRNMRDKLFIDYNGNVMLCELFHKDAVFKHYLDVPLDIIQNWRKQHWICKRCQSYNMHLK